MTGSPVVARLRTLALAHAPRLPPLASTVLVLVLAWLAAQLVWALVPTPAAARWAPPPPLPKTHATQVRPGTPPGSDAAVAGLFGHYAPTTQRSASVQALATAPETHLNLKLLGILADREFPAQSRALVASGGGDEKPYALGEAITSGVLLKAIFPDRIVLSRSGRLETLRLHLDQGNPSGETDVPIAVAGQTVGTAAKLSDIRSKLLSNPSMAGRFVRVQPVRKPGGKGQLGYRVYPGPNRAAFKATGLHPGDLVTAVNGVPLSNPAQTLQLLSELSQARQVTLTIKRGSKTQTATLNFAR